MAYVYMVRCTDDSLYTGIAKNLGQRMRAHYYKKKNGAKYTKSHQIKSLEMVWETEKWSDAGKLEVRIKRLSRPGKEKLIRYPKTVFELFDGNLRGVGYEPHPELTLEMLLEGGDFRKGNIHGQTGEAALFFNGDRQTEGDHSSDLSGGRKQEGD